MSDIPRDADNRSDTRSRKASSARKSQQGTSRRRASSEDLQRSSGQRKSSSGTSRHSSEQRKSSSGASTRNTGQSRTSKGTSQRSPGQGQKRASAGTSQHNSEQRRASAAASQHDSGQRRASAGTSQRSSSQKRSASGSSRRSSGSNSRSRRSAQRRSYTGGIHPIVYLIIGAGLFVFILVTANIVSRLSGRTPERKTASSRTEATSDTGLSADGSGTDALPEPSPTPVPTPVSLTVTVVGDATLGMDSTFDYDTSFNAYYDMYGSDYFMQNMKDIFTADDLTIANLETTLTTADTKREGRYYNFKAPPEYAHILTAGNIEAVSTANNHMYDYLDQGYEDTLKALDAENIVHFGFDETAVMDVKGVKVGLIGIYEIDREFAEIEAEVKEHIERVRSEGAKLVIVIVHWGEELDTMPDQDQTRIARMAIDNGADLVCGHHAHVIQGIELYKGKYICYGLANFCFGGNVYPTDMNTIFFQQTFTVTGDEVAADNNINIIPGSCSSEYTFNNYQPTPYTGDMAVSVMTKLRERTEALTTAEPQPADLLKSTAVDASVLTLQSSGGGLIGGAASTAGTTSAEAQAGAEEASSYGGDESYDNSSGYDSSGDSSYSDEEAYYDSLYDWDNM